jgi:osmoprotectant transport system permease protein
VLTFMMTHRAEVATLTLEHIWLVGISIGLAMLIGVPLGVLLARKPYLSGPIMGATNVIQTIPSLALFGFLLAAPWLGQRAGRIAITALTLYALLPIVRNTFAGIKGVDPTVHEAAKGMGLTDRQILLQVELPLAASIILAGIRTATVISVGIATIAAAIGAGGLGEFIFRGLAMVNDSVILAGAVPAALLALFADIGLGVVESYLRTART